MSTQFIDFNTLEQNTTYTVWSMQYLCGPAEYIYVIKVTKPDNSEYYITVRPGPAEDNIYEKLETIRNNSEKKKFSFKKSLVSISSAVSAPYIVISGDNDIVNLN